MKRFGIERRIKFLLRILNSTILYRILSDISVPNDYLFLFPCRSESMNETRRGREGIFRSSSSKNLLFTNTSPSTKFISLFLCFRKLEILLLSVESKKRFGGETPVRGHNILRTGVEFFAALAATYAKSRVAILALVQPDQSLSVGPCEMWWRRRREGRGREKE